MRRALKTPRDFALDATGTFLVVGSQDGDAVLVFRIGADGKLTRTGAPVTVPHPAAVVVTTLP
jgi:6-phosphogluconolactonase